jgi:hypothetical protein
MTLNTLSISQTLANAKRLLAEEKTISPAFKVVIEVVLLMLQTLMERMNVTSQNSSKPPSQDPNRKKKAANNEGSKKPGGQHGHVGKMKPRMKCSSFIGIKRNCPWVTMKKRDIVRVKSLTFAFHGTSLNIERKY